MPPSAAVTIATVGTTTAAAPKDAAPKEADVGVRLTATDSPRSMIDKVLAAAASSVRPAKADLIKNRPADPNRTKASRSLQHMVSTQLGPRAMLEALFQLGSQSGGRIRGAGAGAGAGRGGRSAKVQGTAAAAAAGSGRGQGRGRGRGRAGGAVPPPKWFRIGCSNIISRCIGQPYGVAALLDLIAGPREQGGDNGPNQWRQWEHAAAMVARSTAGNKPTAVPHKKSIGKQIVDLIRITRDSKLVGMRRAVGCILGKMMGTNADAVKQYVVAPMIRPLLEITKVAKADETNEKEGSSSSGAGAGAGAGGDTSGSSSNNYSADRVDQADGDGAAERSVDEVKEQAVTTSIEDVTCLIEVAAPTEDFFLMLRPALLPLFRVYCLVCKSMSHLKLPVTNVLKAYFKLIGAEDGAEDVTRILFPALRQQKQEQTEHGCKGKEQKQTEGGGDDDDEAGAGAGAGTSMPAASTGAEARARLDGSVLVRGFETVGFGPGPSGGVLLQNADANDMRDLRWEAECILQLLVDLERDELSAAAFGRVLDAYVETLDAHGSAGGGSEGNAREEGSDTLDFGAIRMPKRGVTADISIASSSSSSASPSTSSSAATPTKISSSDGAFDRVLLLETVLQMCEELGPAIVADFVQGIRFVRVMIRT